MILCSCWGWKIAMSTVLWRFPSPMGKSDSISSKEMPYSFSNAFAINWRTCSLGVSLTGRSPVMQSMIFPSPRIASLSVSSGATGSLSGDTMTSSSIVLLTPYRCVMVRPHRVLYLFCSIYIALFVCDASKRLSQSSLSVKLCIGQSQHLYSFSVSRFMITVSRFPKSYIHKTTPLYIQIRILRVALDESPPRSNLVAHQHVEGFVCLHRFLDVHA